VRYRLIGMMTQPTACHCHMCRRHHGALGVFVGARRQAFELQGAEHILWYPSSPEAERGSCKICGSKLFWRQKDGDAMDATTGSLDRQSGLELRAHIWVDHRGDYETIMDDVPKFSASMQGEGERQPIAAAPMATSGNAATSDRHAGGCLCGTIRFEVAGPLRDAVMCHCAQCRHWHGDAAVYAATDLDRVTIRDETALVWYQASSRTRRGFCAKCGACMFWQHLREGQPAGQISVSVGALDAPTGLRVTRHLFINDQAVTFRLIETSNPSTGIWSPGQIAF